MQSAEWATSSMRRKRPFPLLLTKGYLRFLRAKPGEFVAFIADSDSELRLGSDVAR